MFSYKGIAFWSIQEDLRWCASSSWLFQENPQELFHLLKLHILPRKIQDMHTVRTVDGSDVDLFYPLFRKAQFDDEGAIVTVSSLLKYTWTAIPEGSADENGVCDYIKATSDRTEEERNILPQNPNKEAGSSLRAVEPCILGCIGVPFGRRGRYGTSPSPFAWYLSCLSSASWRSRSSSGKERLGYERIGDSGVFGAWCFDSLLHHKGSFVRKTTRRLKTPAGRMVRQWEIKTWYLRFNIMCSHLSCDTHLGLFSLERLCLRHYDLHLWFHMIAHRLKYGRTAWGMLLSRRIRCQACLSLKQGVFAQGRPSRCSIGHEEEERITPWLYIIQLSINNFAGNSNWEFSAPESQFVKTRR